MTRRFVYAWTGPWPQWMRIIRAPWFFVQQALYWHRHGGRWLASAALAWAMVVAQCDDSDIRQDKRRNAFSRPETDSQRLPKPSQATQRPRHATIAGQEHLFSKGAPQTRHGQRRPNDELH